MAVHFVRKSNTEDHIVITNDTYQCAACNASVPRKNKKEYGALCGRCYDRDGELCEETL